MLIKRTNDIFPSEITDESVYLNRRELLKLAGIATAGSLLSYQGFASASGSGPVGNELPGVQKSPFRKLSGTGRSRTQG